MLNQISRAYNIPNNPHGGCPDTLRIQDTDRNSAEMFEGYIGGLFYSHIESQSTGHGEAYDVVRGWLWQVYEPLVKKYYNPLDVSEIEEDKLSKNSKAELHQLFQQYARKLRWGDITFHYDEDASGVSSGTEGQKWKCEVVTVDPKGTVWYV
jgi:hypothetical protein